MKNSVSRVLSLWDTVSCSSLPERMPEQAVQQLSRIVGLFSPGLFYFYILNFHSLEFEYVHPGTQEVLGVPHEEATMKRLISMQPPDELAAMEKKEALVVDFLFNYLPPEERLSYKVVYFFRIQDTSGKYHNMLHQVTGLTMSEEGQLEQILGVHTDISHLKMATHNRVSFIHLGDGPSYYNLNPESGKFDPRSSSPDDDFTDLFTGRELEVIRLLAEGLTAQDIAKRLLLSEHTVRTHRKKVLQKVNCSNTTELVSKCLVHGVI